jgi:hypothetical protein
MKLRGVINQKTTVDILIITVTTTINSITTLGLLRLQGLTLFPLLLEVSPLPSFELRQQLLYFVLIYSLKVFQPFIH